MSTKKKTTKTAKKTAPPEPAPDLELPASGAELPTLGDAALPAHAMERALGGVELEHAGGALPLLTFRRPGEQRLMIFEGREEPNPAEGREFGLLAFTVLDPTRFDPSDPRAARVGMGQMVESHALRSWSRNARPGEVVVVSYGGEIPTKRGQSNLKLFQVARVKNNGEPVVA